MKMIDTFEEYISDECKAQRALFESAMEKRIQTQGYKMSDLMYEVFCCQNAFANLKEQFENLKRELAEMKEPKRAKK